MKKSQKALTIVGAIVLSIAIVFVACACFANSQNDKTPPVDLCDWMSLLNEDTLLKKVAIPGAHDAGTAGLSYLAETQDKTTAQLLECGTRYFDLRVALTNNDLKIYHGPFKGISLDSVLSEIKSFISAHSTETLILDFQHFDGDAQQPTFDKMNEYLSEFLVKNTSEKNDVKFIDSLTLAQCRGKCLIVWGGGNENILNDSAVFKRNNDSGTRENATLHSYYESGLNKKSSSKYIETALPHYIEMYKTQNTGLFVLQGQLTDGLFVFGPRFREASHNKKMNTYISNLEKSDELSVINIVMRDFVSPYKNCLTIRLNLAKNNVKSEKITNFESIIASNM